MPDIKQILIYPIIKSKNCDNGTILIGTINEQSKCELCSVVQFHSLSIFVFLVCLL